MPRNTTATQVIRSVVVYPMTGTLCDENGELISTLEARDRGGSQYTFRYIPERGSEFWYTGEEITVEFLQGGGYRLKHNGVVFSGHVISIDIEEPVQHMGVYAIGQERPVGRIRTMGYPYTGGSVDEAGIFNQEYQCAFIRKKQKYPQMKCAFCNDKIHSPDYLRKLLGPQQTKKYLEFCKKIDAKPTLYCCRCFKTIREHPKFFKEFNNMIKQYKMWKNGYEKMLEAGK